MLNEEPVGSGDGSDSGIVRYTPYGTVRTGNTAGLGVDQIFTGQTSDPGTGLIDYNARQYDPQLGRFIQPDTIIPDMTNPQDLNRYMYVAGNPVNLTDPSGHDACSPETGGGGGCFGRRDYPNYDPLAFINDPVSEGQLAEDAYWSAEGKDREAEAVLEKTAGYDDVIDYILAEMNAHDNWDMDLGIVSDIKMGWRVRPGGSWDHKAAIEARWGRRPEITFVDGSVWEISFDAWSNIHYGYVANESNGPGDIPNSIWAACAIGCPLTGQDLPLDRVYVRFGMQLSKDIDGPVSREDFLAALKIQLPVWVAVKNDRYIPELVNS